MTSTDRQLMLDALALVKEYRPTSARNVKRRARVTAEITRRLTESERPEVIKIWYGEKEYEICKTS